MLWLITSLNVKNSLRKQDVDDLAIKYLNNLLMLIAGTETGGMEDRS